MNDPEIPPDETLSAYLDGELDAAGRDEIDARVASDPEAAARVADWRAIGDAIRDAESVDVPAGLAGRITAAATGPGASPRREVTKRRAAVGSLLGLATLAAAMLVMVRFDTAREASFATPEMADFEAEVAASESLPPAAAAEFGDASPEIDLSADEIAGLSEATPELATSETAAAIVRDAEETLFPPVAVPPVAAEPPASPVVASVGPPLTIRVVARDPDAVREALLAYVTDPFGATESPPGGAASRRAVTATDGPVAKGAFAAPPDRERRDGGDAATAPGGFARLPQTLGIAGADGRTVRGLLDTEMLSRIEAALAETATVVSVERRPEEGACHDADDFLVPRARARVVDRLEAGEDEAVDERGSGPALRRKTSRGGWGQVLNRLEPDGDGGTEAITPRPADRAGPRPVVFVIEAAPVQSPAESSSAVPPNK